MRINDEIIDCIRANLISGNYEVIYLNDIPSDIRAKLISGNYSETTILLDIEDTSTTRYKVIEVDLNDIPSDIRADFIRNLSS